MFTHRRRWSRGGVWGAAVLVALVLAGCAGSPTWLAPQSPNVGMILNLSLIEFIIALIVFIVVEGMLVYSAIRFSRNRGEASQTEGNTRLEIAWTLAPAIVLLIVFFVSLPTLIKLASPPQSPAVAAAGDPPVAAAQMLRVRVIGHQWWWEFQYPDYKIVTADEMHVPAGMVVSLDVESVDVIHSFWVPQLANKVDAIPGHTNHIWFQSGNVGTYRGQCSEFCGVQHANMLFNVVVDSPDQFQAWVQQQQAPVAAVTGAAAEGEQTFMTGACIGCHTLDGTKAKGTLGPNLTHFASRGAFAGAVLPNTPDNLTRWLTDPQAVKPGNDMPNLHLTKEQIAALVAYLESLH